MKKVCVFCFGLLFLSSLVNAQNVYTQVKRDDDYDRKASRYDYIYQDPPRPSLHVAGRYIISTSGVRYVHSPSKHKRASAAARINAYNYQYGNY